MQTVRNYFDRVSSTWDSRCQCKYDAIKRIVNILNLTSGQTILDVGTGTGVLLPFLMAEVGTSGEVTALDVSPEMLKIAWRKFGACCNVGFKLFDIETGSLAQRYDRIVMFNMFPHLLVPNETINNLVRNNLTTSGVLTIAHYPGREFINSVHRRKDCDVHSCSLPPVSRLAQRYLRHGLSVQYAEDTDDFYILQLQNYTTHER